MEWNKMEKDGVGWDKMEKNEWDGIRWKRMKKDGEG